jgi:hypothetical protein
VGTKQNKKNMKNVKKQERKTEEEHKEKRKHSKDKKTFEGEVLYHGDEGHDAINISNRGSREEETKIDRRGDGGGKQRKSSQYEQEQQSKTTITNIASRRLPPTMPPITLTITSTKARTNKPFVIFLEGLALGPSGAPLVLGPCRLFPRHLL